LVASIRSDYQVPGDYRDSAVTAKSVAGGNVKKVDLLLSRKVQQLQLSDDMRSQHDKSREARLRAAWDQLPLSEREEILATVKSQNPSLGRWKNMLEPLCLSELETRLNEPGVSRSQQMLFPGAEVPE
jgi:hypothetical protein